MPLKPCVLTGGTLTCIAALVSAVWLRIFTNLARAFSNASSSKTFTDSCISIFLETTTRSKSSSARTPEHVRVACQRNRVCEIGRPSDQLIPSIILAVYLHASLTCSAVGCLPSVGYFNRWLESSLSPFRFHTSAPSRFLPVSLLTEASPPPCPLQSPVTRRSSPAPPPTILYV